MLTNTNKEILQNIFASKKKDLKFSCLRLMSSSPMLAWSTFIAIYLRHYYKGVELDLIQLIN